jgi:hypothetical protein
MGSKNVQMPNGDVIQFPDTMSDQEVSAAIQSQYRPGVPKAPVPAGLQGPAAPPPQPSFIQKAGGAAKDVLSGIGAGALSTLNNVGSVVYPDAIAKHISGLPTQQQKDSYFAPQNTTQAIAKGGEQALEFLAPGGLEKEGAAKLATALPKLGKYAAPLSRIAAGALSAGTVNKAQGGSFGAGAATGGVGGSVAEGARAVAPMIAESALGVRAPDRAFGRTPGRAILDETTGINPGKIAQQAKSKLSLYGNQLDSMAAGIGTPVDLSPARQVAKNAEMQATLRNNPDTIKRVGQLNSLLSTEHGTGAAIPQQVPPTRALALKRGLGELVGSWNPATPNTFADAATKNSRRILDQGIDAVVPGSQQINEKLSSIEPIANRAGATDLNAGFIQRGLGRLTKPTGALIPAGLGASAGAATAGPLGALAGGALGLFGTEALGSPTSQMVLARGANSALVPPVVRVLSGAGLQADRKKSLYGQ